MDANDIEILEFIQEITGATRALNYLSKDESEDWMKKYYRKMGDWFVKVDLWLNSKTDDEKMKLFRTDTIQTFLIITDLYLRTDKARFSGMDIEKGYYNIEDSFYMDLKTWYDLIQRHYKTAHDNLMSESHSEVTPQKPQPEIGETAHEPQPEQMTAKLTRGRGRPKETLKDKMINDADGKKLQRLHEIWGGRKGKDAALIIVACIKTGWMSKPTYTQVKDEFGDIGHKSGYNKYIDEKKFTDEEIEGAKNNLR